MYLRLGKGLFQNGIKYAFVGKINFDTHMVAVKVCVLYKCIQDYIESLFPHFSRSFW